MLILLLFFLGLSIGSFINSFLWRYEKKISFSGRSMCPECSQKIRWYDNIPLLSWLILRGKCRQCHKNISLQYPVVELITGLLFAIIPEASGNLKYFYDILAHPEEIHWLSSSVKVSGTLVLLAIIGTLVTITVFDLKNKEIPNGFNLTFIALSFLYVTLLSTSSSNFWTPILINTLAGAISFLFFYFFVYISKETWMGGGDAKMAFGMGLLLGPAGVFLAILLSSVIGSIYGLSLIFWGKQNGKGGNRKLGLKSEIPFGPFLALGTVIALGFGERIIDFYVRIVVGI